MKNHSFVEENEAAREELSRLISRLDERSFQAATGPGWTVATSLCHLAFWDQRVLFLLREWERSGKIEPSPLNSQSVESINRGVNAISQAVPGPAAARLALECASAVDSQVAGISGEFAENLISAGLERYVKRFLHRREHLQKIRQVLDGLAAG